MSSLIFFLKIVEILILTHYIYLVTPNLRKRLFG